MTFGAIGGAVAGAAVTSMLGGGGGGGVGNAGAQAAAGAADPFAAQRPQYQQQLSDLLSGKTQFTDTPGAQFAMQEGMGGLEAKMAARGQSNSGAEKAELLRYGTGFAQQQYQQDIMNLMSLSGATSGSPGTAGNILAGQNTADQNALATFGSTVGKAITNNWPGQTQPTTQPNTDPSGFNNAGITPVTYNPTPMDTGLGSGNFNTFQF